MIGMQLLIGKAKRGVYTTGRLMRRIAISFASDVVPYLTLSPLQFYERVRDIPYREDPNQLEFLQRPAITLSGRGPGGDCDDKAIALASYYFLNGVRFRFVAGSRKVNGPLHHVWVRVYIEGRWSNLDATYAWNSMGELVGEWPKQIVIG
jgi:transglutaminase-like putative cysteine protease